jgi:hypothetical protein
MVAHHPNRATAPEYHKRSHRERDTAGFALRFSSRRGRNWGASRRLRSRDRQRPVDQMTARGLELPTLKTPNAAVGQCSRRTTSSHASVRARHARAGTKARLRPVRLAAPVLSPTGGPSEVLARSARSASTRPESGHLLLAGEIAAPPLLRPAGTVRRGRCSAPNAAIEISATAWPLLGANQPQSRSDPRLLRDPDCDARVTLGARMLCRDAVALFDNDRSPQDCGLRGRFCGGAGSWLLVPDGRCRRTSGSLRRGDLIEFPLSE